MKVYVCLRCGERASSGNYAKRKFCSNVCQAAHTASEKVKSWLSGEDTGWSGKTRQLKKFVRRYLFDTRGTACEKCGWDVRHEDGSILTEIDHIDGNAENCKPENLRILCPNCHALTPTFRTRNRDSKRNR